MKRSAKYLRYAAILILVAVTALGVVGCNGGDDGDIEVLRWGLIPADDAQEMMRQYEPVADYLEEKLDLKVEVTVTTDYTAAILAMKNNHIEMAWFGPFSYVLAAEEAGAEAIVNGVRRDTGNTTYRTIFVTTADSGIRTLDDLVGRDFAFVDPTSTSGYLVPMAILLEHGIDPERDFAHVTYAGSHNFVELVVQNGTVDAGADSDTSYYRMVEAGEIDPDVNVIIYRSEPIPGSPIAVRGDLPRELKDQIQQALIEMSTQSFYEVQGWGNIERYVEIDDSDYDVIREKQAYLEGR
jgi:phosphonate transport system substrate-binding protein